MISSRSRPRLPSAPVASTSRTIIINHGPTPPAIARQPPPPLPISQLRPDDYTIRSNLNLLDSFLKRHLPYLSNISTAGLPADGLPEWTLLPTRNHSSHEASVLKPVTYRKHTTTLRASTSSPIQPSRMYKELLATRSEAGLSREELSDEKLLKAHYEGLKTARVKPRYSLRRQQAIRKAVRIVAQWAIEGEGKEVVRNVVRSMGGHAGMEESIIKGKEGLPYQGGAVTPPSHHIAALIAARFQSSVPPALLHPRKGLRSNFSFELFVRSLLTFASPASLRSTSYPPPSPPAPFVPEWVSKQLKLAVDAPVKGQTGQADQKKEQEERDERATRVFKALLGQEGRSGAVRQTGGKEHPPSPSEPMRRPANVVLNTVRSRSGAAVMRSLTDGEVGHTAANVLAIIEAASNPPYETQTIDIDSSPPVAESEETRDGYGSGQAELDTLEARRLAHPDFPTRLDDDPSLGRERRSKGLVLLPMQADVEVTGAEFLQAVAEAEEPDYGLGEPDYEDSWKTSHLSSLVRELSHIDSQILTNGSSHVLPGTDESLERQRLKVLEKMDPDSIKQTWGLWYWQERERRKGSAKTIEEDEVHNDREVRRKERRELGKERADRWKHAMVTMAWSRDKSKGRVATSAAPQQEAKDSSTTPVRKPVDSLLKLPSKPVNSVAAIAAPFTFQSRRPNTVAVAVVDPSASPAHGNSSTADAGPGHPSRLTWSTILPHLDPSRVQHVARVELPPPYFSTRKHPQRDGPIAGSPEALAAGRSPGRRARKGKAFERPIAVKRKKEDREKALSGMGKKIEEWRKARRAEKDKKSKRTPF